MTVVADEQTEVTSTPYDGAILIRWEAGRPIFNLEDMDVYAAITVLRQLADHLEDTLPSPVQWDELDDGEDSDATDPDDEGYGFGAFG